MPIPAGWEPDPDDSTFYIASQTLGGEVVRFTVNSVTGDYSIKSDTRGDVVTYNAKDDRVTYLNDDFKTKVQNDNIALSTIRNIIPQRINEINKTLSQIEDSGIDSQDREEFLEGDKYRRIEETVTDETPDGGSTGNTDPEPEIVNANDLVTIVKAKTTQEKFEPLVYPKTINTIQDYIQFTIGKYKPKDLKGGENIVTLSERPQTLTEIYGTISLPIQPSIVDSNSVAWNENELNPLQVALLKEGINIAENGVDVNGIAGKIDSFLKEGGSQEVANYGKLFLAQKAVGAQNLQSRFGGGIVNPNMELLFTGPQLRPFNFNFRLSPREVGEADTVRKIIKTFKLSMAPKVSSANAFLAAPSIFQIKYLRSEDNDDHPSLNRIKLCALKSCVVDYTPENSYMTFKDASNTMVSYNLSLQFQELEPVYDQDYNSGKEEIGY